MSTRGQQSKFTFMNSEYDSTSFQLDSEIEERIREARKGKKIAFLSGMHRTYYPEQVGNTKFAQVFNPFGDSQLPPYKPYKPPDTDRLDKPISTKGYGMGGLLGPRFPSDAKAKLPGPGQYHTHTQRISFGRQHQFPPQVWMNFGLLKTEEAKTLRDAAVSKRLTSMWSKCHQIRVAFGTNVKKPRFGRAPKWNCVGPGHYSLREYKQPKFPINKGFLRGPVIFNPSTKLHCSYGPKDPCLECGMMLMSSLDYYRSKYYIAVPSLEDAMHAGKKIGLQKSESIFAVKPPASASSDTADTPNQKQRILLCRECHCKALRGESKYFADKKDVDFLFEKTRHCGYIHDHNGFPEYTEKASCRWTRKLMKKEAILNLHYSDKCEKRMVEKKKK